MWCLSLGLVLRPKLLLNSLLVGLLPFLSGWVGCYAIFLPQFGSLWLMSSASNDSRWSTSSSMLPKFIDMSLIYDVLCACFSSFNCETTLFSLFWLLVSSKRFVVCLDVFMFAFSSLVLNITDSASISCSGFLNFLLYSSLENVSYSGFGPLISPPLENNLTPDESLMASTALGWTLVAVNCGLPDMLLSTENDTSWLPLADFLMSVSCYCTSSIFLANFWFFCTNIKLPLLS